MYMRQTHRHLQVWMGLLFFLLGFCGEGIAGVWLLRRVDPQLFLLHVCAVLMWAFGINLLCNSGASQGESVSNAYTFVNKWGIGALLLGLFTFPGSGALAYSVALVMATILLHRKKGDILPELEQAPENVQVADAVIQPTMDVLQDTDLETKRLAVATLRRQGTPEAMQVLRQLLSDPHAEIRSDASIALTHLEDTLSRSLNSSLEQWMKNPSDRESTLNLADQYYQYAQSNVLDEASQHFYLVKAHDLLQRVTTEGATEPDIWLKLARICQLLDKFEEALQDVRIALQLGHRTSDAYLLAMELAFRLHDWDSLVAFACEGVSVLPNASEISESLQWWATLRAQKHGESVHV